MALAAEPVRLRYLFVSQERELLDRFGNAARDVGSEDRRGRV